MGLFKKIGKGFKKVGKGLKKAANWVGNKWDDITGVTASQEAAKAQRDAAAQAQKQLSPYTEAAKVALPGMQDLMGLSGDEAQQQAIANIQNSPMFTAQVQQGEEALLQNAAATGGLRGGNTQAALAQFRPMLLNQAIQQRFANLGTVAGLGANATGQASANLMNLGGSQASARLAQYQLNRQGFEDLAGLGMQVAGMF